MARTREAIIEEGIVEPQDSILYMYPWGYDLCFEVNGIISIELATGKVKINLEELHGSNLKTSHPVSE